MRAWRISRRKLDAFDGEGARLYGGRWNRPGLAVVYCAETLSLAALEYFLHTDPDLLPADLVATWAEIPPDVTVAQLTVKDLPDDWRHFPPPDSLQALGSEWIESAEQAVLSLPSVVIPEEHNLLLNPAHPDFQRIRILGSRPFEFDPRMWKTAAAV